MKSKNPLSRLLFSFAVTVLIMFFSLCLTGIIHFAALGLSEWTFRHIDRSVSEVVLNGEATIRTPTPTIKKCAEVAVTETYILRYGVRNELATKAFKMSGGDMDFLKTVEVESNWDPKAIGDNGNSKGLCQWHYRWQKAIRNDPNFKDPDWQLQKCFDFYSWYKEQWILGSRLYGFKQRHSKDHVFQVKTYQNIVSIYKCD